MKKNDFWLLSLVVFTMLGLKLSWPIALRIVVVLNSIIVLYECIKVIHTKHSKGDKNE